MPSSAPPNSEDSNSPSGRSIAIDDVSILASVASLFKYGVLKLLYSLVLIHFQYMYLTSGSCYYYQI